MTTKKRISDYHPHLAHASAARVFTSGYRGTGSSPSSTRPALLQYDR